MDAANRIHLQRAFERLCADAITTAQVGRERAIVTGAQEGFGGNTLMSVCECYTNAGSETMARMAQLAYDVTATNSGSICGVLEHGLRALRDRLSNELADFFRSQRTWAPVNATDAVGDVFLNALNQRIIAVVDDFRHGFLGGQRLAKDPLVSVVTSVANSPGAVVQSGVGNTEAVLSTSQVQDARSAIAQFIQSKEVQALRPEDRESLSEIAEVVADELGKPSPDRSKLARWGKRLLGVAEKVGVAVVTTTIERALFGGRAPS